MLLFFAGSEISSHRKVLSEVGAKNAALSFMGLRRRIKHPDKWVVADKYPEGMGLLLDSGAFTVNKSPMDYTQADLKAISEDYHRFVTANIDRLVLVTEFDALSLGKEWIETQREEFYDQLDAEKFMPIWHPEWGIEYLKEMAGKYSNIGVPTTDIAGRNLTPVLNGIADDGVNLHGVGMTKPDDMASIRWHSVSSTSWVSPQQYGDTIVWTGRELKRYPKKAKDQARRRYRTLFDREGFDAQKIADDDTTEVLRLSIWSWEKLVEDIEHKAGPSLHIVARSTETPTEDFPEVDGEVVVMFPPEERNSVATMVPVRQRDKIPLPVLGVTTSVTKNEETGEDEEVKAYNVRSDSQRKCDTCFLSSKCPAFEAGAGCAYDIPLQIRTSDQFTSVFNSMIEMQAQRVLFMRFAEEMEGGYADPNLSSEMDRLTKMMKAKNDMETDGFSFKIEGKSTGPGQGQGGMLSRIFGEDASRKARELEAPVRVEQVTEAIDVEFSES